MMLCWKIEGARSSSAHLAELVRVTHLLGIKISIVILIWIVVIIIRSVVILGRKDSVDVVVMLRLQQGSSEASHT